MDRSNARVSIRGLFSHKALLGSASVLAAVLMGAASPVLAEATTSVPNEGSASEKAQGGWQARVRIEGLERSQVMGFVTQLADGIGPRLTGSPGMARSYEWSLETLSALGLENPRLEPIDMAVIGWRQTHASVRMVEPEPMVFLAQAGAWSVATPGVVEGEVVAVSLRTDEDLAANRGRLGGKIVLLGPLRPVPPTDRPQTVRYSEAEILSGEINEPVRETFRTMEARRAGQAQAGLFAARLRAFLEAEGVKAVLLPSRDGAHGGGSGNLSIDEGPFSVRSWSAVERPSFPFVYAAIEHFGRAWRLAQGDRPVRLEVRLDVEETPGPEPVYNVVADLPGQDPELRPQIVLAGAHLDSWASGTGALDNATGVAAVLEAVRILKASGYQPRRTIRVVLFGAEEQGLHGSLAYAKRHLGAYPRAVTPDQLALSAEGRRTRTGPLQTLPDYDDFSIAYNMDAGSGRIRGVYAGGNPQLAALYRSWIEPLKDLGVIAVYDEPFWPADQSTFSDIGLPGIMFLHDPLDYFTRARHSNLDTLERVSPEDMAQISTVLATFLGRSAETDALAPRPPLP
ncbi:M20/M25/M40 family metallo-hydrolase [Brevundimonas diminuta]|uniref:M20/M25/M40 family metallo-hydrolase n=1 Tax=Brevundimonas diminuta TaxID=293 RepID=UPI0037C5926E